MIKMNRKYIDKTFDECFQEFLLEHCTLKNMREDTKKYYIENMKYGFYKYYDKDTNINKFTQDDINGYILYLQNKNIKDTTINIYLKALKTIIIFYKNKFWIDINITVMLVKEDKQQIEGYTDEEISVLIKKPNMKEVTFAQYRNWVCVNFLCCTGSRRSTVINIHKEDLDLNAEMCRQALEKIDDDLQKHECYIGLKYKDKNDLRTIEYQIEQCEKKLKAFKESKERLIGK